MWYRQAKRLTYCHTPQAVEIETDLWQGKENWEGGRVQLVAFAVARGMLSSHILGF
jgi:hypothetical protein